MDDKSFNICFCCIILAIAFVICVSIYSAHKVDVAAVNKGMIQSVYDMRVVWVYPDDIRR